MKTATRLRSTTEEDIARALASLSPASWPQDEKDLLVLFNRLLDLKIGSPLQRQSQSPPHRSIRRLQK